MSEQSTHLALLSIIRRIVDRGKFIGHRLNEKRYDYKMKCVLAAILLTTATYACSSDELKAEGAQCFGSAECSDGLTCDFGQSPAVCAVGQTAPLVDANNVVEIDATLTDATPGLPDAEVPDAAVTPIPDAMLGVPDAALPDAALPDAALPDAALPDAALPDAAVPT